MTLKDLNTEISLGEDSRRQFKLDVKNAESLAAEMAAFANANGGKLLIGVGEQKGQKEQKEAAVGLEKQDVMRINQLISNAASHLVRSPLAVETENVKLKNGKLVIVVSVPNGIDKPYFDKNGVIWLKVGADKRRVNSKEELRRLFQMTEQFHADELPTKAKIEDIDELRFRDFLRKTYKRAYPRSKKELTKLLKNMNLSTDTGNINLGGLLLFAEEPQFIRPEFVIKGVCYPGNKIHINKYDDIEEFSGPLNKIFTDALRFIMRNLHKLQKGQSVNSPGIPEVPECVFEELLVNALIHRDYLISAPIRLFIFDDCIEIISPGNLPNSLSVEKIMAGNSNIRNPILASYAAKGLLPYYGLGSGINRAIEAWKAIDFEDDRDAGLFRAIIHRET